MKIYQSKIINENMNKSYGMTKSTNDQEIMNENENMNDS
jgi:hypothetical protein